ncbi:MAG: hypothetical protein HGN29_05855 [Asgard group archaeon]|nr:hypothetical protein [Asgard group archaeon]
MSKTLQHEKLIAYSIMLVFLVLTIVLPFTLTRDTSGYILIESDKDFKKYKLPGNGSSENPYIIENVNVVDSMKRGISIENTTKHFIIQNCYLDGNFFNGIRIANIAEGTAKIFNNTCVSHSIEGIIVLSSDSTEISNNTCYNNKIGIGLYDSNNSTIKHNYVYRYLLADDREGHSDRGIVVSNSKYVSITGNRIKKTSGGMEIEFSENCFVSNNIVQTSYQFSIGLVNSFNCQIVNSEFKSSIRIGVSLFDSNENSIQDCLIKNSERGIRLYNATNNIIESNQLEINFQGISLYSESNSNLIIYNVFSNSSNEGIEIDDGSFNKIHHNSFYENNKGEISQASDNGYDNRWYDDVSSEGNFWYGWNASFPYEILGNANSTDPFPLNDPATLPSLFPKNSIRILILYWKRNNMK